MTRGIVAMVVVALAGARVAVAQPMGSGTGETRQVEVAAGFRTVARAEFSAGGAIPDFGPELMQELAAARKVVPAAYRFFVHGAHPFKRFVRYLDPVARPGASDPYGDKAGRRTPEIALAGVRVELFLRPGTPPEVARKLAYDFVLAQAFNRGFFASQALYQDDTGITPLDVVRESTDTLPMQELARLVAFATLHRKDLAALIAAGEARHDGEPPSAERASAIVRLRALVRVLHGQAIGGSIITAAAQGQDRSGDLMLLLLVSSDRDRASLRTLRRAFGDPAFTDGFAQLFR